MTRLVLNPEYGLITDEFISVIVLDDFASVLLHQRLPALFFELHMFTFASLEGDTTRLVERPQPNPILSV